MLSEHRWLRRFTLCALYFAQGVPHGFVTITLAATLAKAGVPKEQIGGLIALSILPWSFKIIWGPIIDSYRLPVLGQRRPWIVLAQLLMATTLLVTFAVGDVSTGSAVSTLGIIFFVYNCFASLQDVSTDALAVDLLDEKERGRVNGFMWASKLLGISVGGAGTAKLIAVTDLETGMRALGAVVLVIMLLPLIFRERASDALLPGSRHPARLTSPVDQPARTNPIIVARSLLRAFGMRTTALALMLAILAFVGEGLATPILAEVFTVGLDWSVERYADNQAIYGTIGKLVGALGGGFICDLVGVRRIAGLGFGLAAATLAVFGLTSGLWGDGYPYPAFFILVECGLALASVSLFAFFMRISWTAAAATQFTLYMTVLNLGHALGPLIPRLPFGHLMNGPAFLVLAGALTVLPIAVLPFLDPAAVVRRRGIEPAAPTRPPEHAP